MNPMSLCNYDCRRMEWTLLLTVNSSWNPERLGLTYPPKVYQQTLPRKMGGWKTSLAFPLEVVPFQKTWKHVRRWGVKSVCLCLCLGLFQHGMALQRGTVNC